MGETATTTAAAMALEEWRDVLGGVYQVSNLGNVRRAACGGNSRPLRPVKVHAGQYLVFTASIRNVRKTMLVHRLVAEAFIGPCPPGHVVNHKDANKHNAKADNLEYVTPAGNDAHAMALGLKATGNRHGSRLHPERLCRGENVNTAILQPDDVRLIRTLRGNGASLNSLAERFGVTFSNVSRICLRKTWKHL